MQYSFHSLSTEADAKDLEEFFKDKDVSKFNLGLHQALDTIRAHDAVIKVRVFRLSCASDTLTFCPAFEG